MKLDNPKLTAFALGEVSPAEQAEFEEQMRSDREIAAEIEETREIARILRAGLGAERAAGFADHQRDAIFREAELARKVHEAGSGSARNETFAPLIVPRSTWWNRPGPWQAIAACTVAGFAAYALFVNVGGHWRAAGLSDAGEIVVQVPKDMEFPSNGTGEPNLISPQELSAQTGTASAGFSPIKTVSSVPKLNGVSPEVQIDPKAPAVAETNPPEPASSQQPGSERPRRKGPQVVGTKNDELANRLAAASIGRQEKTPGTVTDAEMAVLRKLQQRMTEAGDLREGSSYKQFSEIFRPSPGTPGQYEMIESPSIKVDAEFATADGQPLKTAPTPESRVKRISSPYFE